MLTAISRCNSTTFGIVTHETSELAAQYRISGAPISIISGYGEVVDGRLIMVRIVTARSLVGGGELVLPTLAVCKWPLLTHMSRGGAKAYRRRGRWLDGSWPMGHLKP